MHKRISALPPRGVVTIDALRALRENRLDTLLPACLTALNRGNAPIDRRALPPTGSRMTGGAIVFGADSSGLDGRSRAALDRWSALLGADRAVRVLIGAFTSHGADGDPSGRCLIEIVDPHRARWRN